MDPLLERIYSLSEEECRACARNLMLGGGTRGGPLIVRGQGVRLYDSAGKDYIDCTSQSWAMYLGFSNPDINRVVAEQMQRMSHVHQGYDTLPRFYLARKLASLAPAGLSRVSFTVGGGPALEAAMKIAVKNTQPSRDFVCLWDGYHGTTLATMGASWISTRSSGKLIGGSRFLGLTRPFVRVPNPYCYRCFMGLTFPSCGLACAKMLRMTLEKGVAGNAAGVILETVQASGGQIVAPKEYLQEVRRICDDFGVPLIYDEIQTYGRIGHFFSADHFGVAPDIIVLGKGLGAGLPLAGIIVAEKLAGFEPDTEELHTFANNSAAQVAAAKQIELLEGGVLANARAMGAYLRQGLEAIARELPEIGDIRQLGLHVGVELVKDRESRTPLYEEGKKVRDEAIARGLLLGLAGPRTNILKVKPPLVISRAECDEVLDKFRAAAGAVLRK